MKAAYVDFKTTKEESILITKIVKRFWNTYGKDVDVEFRNIEMDVTACHCNGNPLRLADLLAADDFNFAHDVFGICRNLDRRTGTLENCFSPRYLDRAKKTMAA